MTDAWMPAFPGQRPPFQPGHELSMKAGHWSERRVGPLADRFVAALLTDDSMPGYLHEPSYRPALMAWGRAEAIVALLEHYITEVGLPKAMVGKVPLVETLRKWEVTAANHRARLGLDPGSRARILRDLAATRYMTGPSAFDAALDARARARELEGGNEEL